MDRYGLQFLYGRGGWIVPAALSFFWLLTVLALWPRRMPGPLTWQERQLAGRRLRARVTPFVLPLLVCLIGLAALTVLVVRPGRSTVLVLWSRAAFDAPGAELLKVDKSDYEVRDLGPVVDAVMANPGRIATIFEHFPPRSSDLRDLDEALAEQLRKSPPPLIKPGGGVSKPATTGANPIPGASWSREVKESLEISLIRLAVRRYHVRDVRVWGGPGRASRETWNTAEQIFAADGSRLTPLRSTSMPEGEVAVEFFADVTGFADGRVTGYVSLAGQFKDDSPEILDAWIGIEDSDPSTVVPVHFEVPADKGRHRLVRFAIPPNSAVAPRLRTLFNDPHKRPVAIKAGPSGTPGENSSTRVRVLPSSRIPLQVYGAEASRVLKLLVDAQDAPMHDSTAAFLRDQLEEIGVAVPEPAGATAARAALIVTGGVCVIAKTAQRAKEVRLALGNRGPNAMIAWEDSSRRMGPPSLTSWENLQLPGGQLSPDVPEPDRDFAAVRKATLSEPTPVARGRKPGAWRVSSGDDRAVVLVADARELLDPNSESSTIETSYALLRWVAWGTTYVADDAFAEENGRPPIPPDGGNPAGPSISRRGEELVLRWATWVAAVVATLSITGYLGWVTWNRWDHARGR